MGGFPGEYGRDSGAALAPIEAFRVIESSRVEPAQKYFMRSVIEKGRAFYHDFGDGPVCILDVSTILNHGVDVPLIRSMAQTIAKKLEDLHPTVALTAASSGNILTYAICEQMGIPRLITAAKSPNIIHQYNGYVSTDGYSYTGGHGIELVVSKELLDQEDTVLILDDFLDTGTMTERLCNLVDQVGARLVGCGYGVNKIYAGGQQKVEDLAREKDIDPSHIASFIGIVSMSHGEVLFEGMPKPFLLSKQV